MPFLNELARSLKASSELSFRFLHGSPVLVGLGIAGYLSSNSMGPATMVVDFGDLETNATWSQRVFELRPSNDSASRGRVITVGRTSATTITINDFTVSREQCAFHIEGEKYSITDIGSRNGTLVGTTLLRKTQTAVLTGGEVINFGRLSFEFLTPDGLFLRCQQVANAP